MSQAQQAPREYKFVGAFSRKRRRRNGHVLTTEPEYRVGAATSRRPTPPAKEPAITFSISTTSTTTDADIPPVLAPPVDDGPMTGGDVDWAFSKLMNPFLDAGPLFMGVPPFDQQFGPDMMPPLQLDDAPLSTNSSTDDYPDHESHDELVDDLVLAPIRPGAAPSNIPSTIAQLLSRYDREFCVLPLTCDFDANPFRSHPDYGRDSQLLHHCILALSYKHINRDTGTCEAEARLHKKMALRMLKDIEGSSRWPTAAPSRESTFLDAILILMTLDCATSARGPWAWYLKRAYNMMQVLESMNIPKTPRMQARVEILVWWDVTLALTARQGCVLSESTMLNLLDRDKANTPTFYSVSGCPEALFRCMIRLGSYARELELVSRMTCAKFDLAPVLAVEKEIREWSDTEYEGLSGQQEFDSSEQNADTEDLAHYKEDLHHCAEAWRYALLTYVVRVFRWERDKPAPRILGFLARKTLNHVSSCRCTSMIQKQLLLPVFLAGCETTDEHLRRAARAYCSWWNDWTRYDMFLTADALLDKIWKSQSPQDWWGSVIDQKSASNNSNRQFLFG